MSCWGAARFNSTASSAVQNPRQNGTSKRPASRAFIALGSNMGNRLEMLENACQRIDQTSTTKVIRTSGLWETEPMYVKNQDRFLNGVCEVGNIFQI
jgi:2-amino-4-hydroxy-6-hydroxymethyldihydropteridine diphosphokinase/dihydropteroate synthase